MLRHVVVVVRKPPSPIHVLRVVRVRDLRSHVAEMIVISRDDPSRNVLQRFRGVDVLESLLEALLAVRSIPGRVDPGGVEIVTSYGTCWKKSVCSVSLVKDSPVKMAGTAT